MLLAEYNRVLPYTYMHRIRRQSYTGMNEGLAHPLGANFSETVCQLQYQYKSTYLSLKCSNAFTGKDATGSNFGSNLSLSDTTASVTSPFFEGDYPGIGTSIVHVNTEIGYIINPRYNFILSAGINYRKEIQSHVSKITNLVYIKLSTQILNNYKDF